MPDEPSGDDQILVRYLLGSLPEEQAERLDDMSVSDDDFVWKLRTVENDLVDAYLRNELSGETLQRFRSFYLSSGRRREKVKFAAALLTLSARESLSSPSWFAAPLMIPRWGLVSGIATALALGGLLLYENAGLLNQVHDAERERSSLTTAKGHESASAQPLVALVLAAPVRGVGPIPELSVSAGAERAAFELKLETDDFPAYVVTLKDGAGTRSLWRSEELKSVRGRVSVIAPANLLQSGNYLFQISPARPNTEPLANYAFRVDSQ